MHLDASACEHGERRLYFMVPVPAVCEWAQNVRYLFMNKIQCACYDSL